MSLFQRIIFVVLFIASVSQAMASTMMPEMSSMNQNIAHQKMMQQMNDQQQMLDCHSMDECQEQCDCCPGTCSSVSLFLINSETPQYRAYLADFPTLNQAVTSLQSSLYRPPISA